MARSFNDEITRLSQQKQAISGRAPSRNEVAGVVEGLASGSSERLARSKALQLEDKNIEVRERAEAKRLDLDTKRLAEEKRIADTEIQFAHDATMQEIKAGRKETGATVGAAVGGAVGAASAGKVGAALGTYISPGVGTVVGAGIGTVIGLVVGGSSWICSAIHQATPWTLSEQKSLIKLFRYVHENHKPQFDVYQKIGRELAKYGKREDVLVVIELVKNGKMEGAYQEYYRMCQKIIDKHIPELRRAA